MTAAILENLVKINEELSSMTLENFIEILGAISVIKEERLLKQDNNND